MKHAKLVLIAKGIRSVLLLGYAVSNLEIDEVFMFDFFESNETDLRFH